MFEWDSANIDHIAKHGVTPAEAEQVILNQAIEVGFQHHGKEIRTAQVGETDQGRILFVVTTWRNNLARVVTAFPAKKALRAAYAAQKRKQIERGISKEELQE